MQAADKDMKHLLLRLEHDSWDHSILTGAEVRAFVHGPDR